MNLRILVVGFGFMGQTHAGNLLRNPQAELAGIVDLEPPIERLASIKGNRDTVHLSVEDICRVPHFVSLETALTSADADAAIIALPTKHHCNAVLQCLEHGLHVMVEKPFSISLKECAEMCRIARGKEKVLAVGYVVRAMKEYQYLRETIHNGHLGLLRFLSLSRVTGYPAWGNWNDPAFRRASGGALFDLVSHDLDFAEYCLGDPDDIAIDPILCREFDGNMIQAVLRYPKCNVKIEGGFVSPPNFPFRRNFTAYFDNGTLCSDCSGEYQEITSAGIRTESFPDDDPYYTEVARFIDAIQNGDHSGICSGEDGRRSIQVCHRIIDQLTRKPGIKETI